LIRQTKSPGVAPGLSKSPQLLAKPAVLLLLLATLAGSLSLLIRLRCRLTTLLAALARLLSLLAGLLVGLVLTGLLILLVAHDILLSVGECLPGDSQEEPS
jgi:hypothetical protein